MANLAARRDSYAFWLLVSLVPAGLVGVTTQSVVEAAMAALVVAAFAYLYFNYPF